MRGSRSVSVYPARLHMLEPDNRLAPHADKVPLPIVQGLAATVFPPAQVVVPVIRYLQTSPSSKQAIASSAEGLTTLAGPPSPQIYVIPFLQKPSPPHPRAHALHKTLRDLGVWAQRHPVLAVALVYAAYRARGVPGRAVRALDRAVNAVCAWVWVSAMRAMKRQREWAAKQVGRVKEKAQGA